MQRRDGNRCLEPRTQAPTLTTMSYSPIAINTSTGNQLATIQLGISDDLSEGRLLADDVGIRYAAKMDGDGLLDLVLQIDVTQLELTSNDTEAKLTGRTKDGVSVIGRDSIKLVP